METTVDSLTGRVTPARPRLPEVPKDFILDPKLFTTMTLGQLRAYHQWVWWRAERYRKMSLDDRQACRKTIDLLFHYFRGMHG